MAGGGWRAIGYTIAKAREAGWNRLWRAMRSKNACKTCALGMGGQKGGMVNEKGVFPEVCKKSLQAMAADMQPGIDPAFWRERPLTHLKAMSPRNLEYAGRLVQPLRRRRGEPGYSVVPWQEALDGIAQRLRAVSPEQSFWYFSGRSSNEAGFLLQLAARMFGSNHVNNCSYYCHQASGVGLNSAVGSGTATVVLDDVEHADLVFVIGGNPASNHPRLMTLLADVRGRGGKVIVVNPVVESGLVRFKIPSRPWSLMWGTSIASRYLQPHIGGDLALLWAISKHVDELGAADQDFLDQHCSGAEAWREALRATRWEDLVEKSGVARHEIEAAARDYAKAQNVVFCWTMGITHHEHGVQNVQAIANLALQRGMVGRPHAGLLPIRGHSNVQGIGSVGATPRLKDAILERTEAALQVKLPSSPGLDTLGCLEAAHRGDMKFGFCLGGNLYGASPDSAFAAAALERLDTLVYLSTTLNTGHAWGLGQETWILPVLARDEEPHPTTQESMFNYVRLSDGGPPRHTGPKSEVEIISRLADAAIPGAVDWNRLGEVNALRDLIGRVVPGYAAIGAIHETRQEFQIEGRTFHQPKFATPDGRARLHAHSLPPLRGGTDRLRLMTVRSEGQFNTVVYEEEDIYRGQSRRDVILLHPEDMDRLGLRAAQRVSVISETGRMDHILVSRFADIRPGNALMYFPEANVLAPRSVDPQSRTPAFKCVEIWLET